MKTMQAATILLMSTLIIACDKKTETTTPPKPVKQNPSVPTLLKQNAILAEGINFKTNQFVVVDSVTGKEVKPCILPKTDKAGGQTCDTRIANVDEAVLNALKIDKPIDGVIVKNNKEIKAKFFVSVKAVFEGSYCNTFFLNGEQYEFCYTQEQIDAALE
ncbi:hypothetical protein A1353_11850 [Methylomonas methanica]|uniref:Lipoprotein n=1 Tax=Methylomonas methanica TaxID=421 RepID=A0A177MIT2_METMH|nr:hypothetical protein [Methylomonas methanica]OAI05263.1 hypothetical protein A1353_11850 [Methylomonas methanica]